MTKETKTVFGWIGVVLLLIATYSLYCISEGFWTR
jgi:hypothetical protein